MSKTEKIDSEYFGPVGSVITTLLEKRYPPTLIIESLLFYIMTIATQVFNRGVVEEIAKGALALFLVQAEYSEQSDDMPKHSIDPVLELNVASLEAERPFQKAVEELQALGFSANTVSRFLFRQAFYTSHQLYGREKTEEILWNEHRLFLQNITNKKMPAGHS
jgi:hypothetical protein